jgi:glycosyltransferase involved in cell wall biosynthesis
MSKKPFFSIITPVYNCEKYIEESLDSIYNQNYQDFELIVINDGSTDSTKEKVLSFAKWFKDKMIFIDNDDNKKIPYRRNQGIDISRGKYIVIHDGDDISMPHRLEYSKKVIDANPHVFCIGGHALKIDEDSNITGRMDYPPTSHKEIVEMVTKKCMNPIIDPSTTFRKDIFLSLGKYSIDNNYFLVPDFYLWTRAMDNDYTFMNITEPIIDYRENSQGNTQKYKQEMIKQHMRVWHRFMGVYKNKLRIIL